MAIQVEAAVALTDTTMILMVLINGILAAEVAERRLIAQETVVARGRDPGIAESFMVTVEPA
jgi:hypothetical protein